MNLVDTHCHIHFDSYPLDKARVLLDAAEAGVGKMICVGTTVNDSKRAIEFADAHVNVAASAGVHPHDAEEFSGSVQMQTEFQEILNKSSILAIGEIGLDYYKNYSAAESQKKALRLQIEASLDTGLPFIFHIREAFDDFWEIFDSYPGLRGVVHSFSAGPKELDQIMKRDLYVGLNGIMTFTRDENQLEAAKTVPPDRLLLETDAPFLTPIPDRGKTCEPKHIADIARFLSRLRAESPEHLATATSSNAGRLFGI